MDVIEKDAVVKVFTASIYPELHFTVPVETNNDREFPIFLSGALYTSDNKKVAEVFLGTNYNNRKPEHHVFSHEERYYSRNVSNTRLSKNLQHYHFLSRLSHEAIDYIEKLRGQDRNKDVHFYLELTFQALDCNSDLVDVINASPKIVVKNNMQQREMIDRVQVLLSSVVVQRCSFHILQSKWIQEFTEALRIGKYLLLELNLPTVATTNSQWKEPLRLAIKHLLESEDFLKQGRWDKTIESARKVSELFKYKAKGTNEMEIKNKAALKKLFTDVNLNDKGFDNLCLMIENLFHYISKFAHSKDEKGNLLPELNPKKEDAYFVYTNSVAIVNLIASKLKP